MNTIRPEFFLDFYKVGHIFQYPNGTTRIVSNLTPRGSRISGIDSVVWFGTQYYVLEWFFERWAKDFFGAPIEHIDAFENTVRTALNKPDYSADFLRELHSVGHMPIEIRAIEEGTRVPMRIPCMTIHNTDDRFFWLPNFLETQISFELWQMSTSATIAAEYRKVFEDYAKKTGAPVAFCDWQGHDFSMRGMGGADSSVKSGAGHLISFLGTDTVASLPFITEYYESSSFLGGSVPACYDDDTEILTETGFVRFSELQHPVKVAQYNLDGSIEFVLPSEYYHMPYSGKMVQFKNSGYDTVDLLVTPNHKMVRIKEDKISIELFEAGDTSYRNRKGYSHRSHLPVSGVLRTDNNDTFSNLDRLRVAFQADGSFPSRSESYKSGQIRFSLKKERKIRRLSDILDDLRIDYSVSEVDSRGYVNFWINPNQPDLFRKDFDWVTLDKSREWYDLFIDELSHWDGCIKRNCVIYANTDKSCIDKVQCICAIAGYKSQVSSYNDERENRKILHTIIISDRTMIGGDSITREFVNYSGLVHCVSVPSKMLVVRRNNKVAICGNTEHSVACAGLAVEDGDETKVFENLMEVYPTGILSVVSDTMDFWKVVTETLPLLKSRILARDGKLVIRPDCYDEQTELLTDKGWKFFRDITLDDNIAQVEDSGFSFVKPVTLYNKPYIGKMLKFEDKKGKIDLLVTPNHRMVFERNSKMEICEARNLHMFHGKNFIRSVEISECSNDTDTCLSPKQRMAIAYQADGSPCSRMPDHIRFSFSKKRKIDRIKEIASACGYTFKVYKLTNKNKNHANRVEVSIKTNGDRYTKSFDWVTRWPNSNWAKEFIEECSYWDATRRSNSRFKLDTTMTCVADVIERMALCSGYGCKRVKRSDPRGFLDVYTLHVMKDSRIGGQAIHKSEIDYAGNVYCATVPSGKLLVRRNGSIVVCGNSGDPVKIIIGDPDAATPEERKGLIECLWETFGGNVNAAGFRELDPHIGAIYGDSITLDRQKAILDGLLQKGYASSNIVLGIGSYCVTPDTPILCSDLIWRNAGSLKAGQEIIAFDEYPTYSNGKKASRRYRLAIIEENKPSVKSCIRISTDIGKDLTASYDHPVLVYSKNRKVSEVFMGDGKIHNSKECGRGYGFVWRKMSDLRVGDQVAMMMKPWDNIDNTRSSGWLEGIFDGEGCVARCTETDRLPAWKISISQNQGIILDRIVSELHSRSFGTYVNNRKCAHVHITGGFLEVIRFLGEVHPYRLIQNKLKEITCDMPALKANATVNLATVTSISSCGDTTVASIRTSSGTFITGGYLTHNTYQYVTRDTFGWAIKATHARINGKDYNLFKKPKTDSGIKNSAKGLVFVGKKPDGTLYLEDEVSWDKFQSSDNQLKLIFRDGIMRRFTNFQDIRKRLAVCDNRKV